MTSARSFSRSARWSAGCFAKYARSTPVEGAVAGGLAAAVFLAGLIAGHDKIVVDTTT
jgi:hypothetical protein